MESSKFKVQSSNLNFKSLPPKLKEIGAVLSKHLSFIVILAVLLMYLVVIWNIKALATAEPSAEAESETLAKARIPRIDQKAINQIQSLENNSPQVQALFNNARNNPFHE